MVYKGEATSGDTMQAIEAPSAEFTRFVKEVEPRLSYAFFAAYGPDVGADTTSDALAFGWEHWDRIKAMDNPSGYLFRVGQSKARRYHRRQLLFPPVPSPSIPDVEPKLPEALGRLTSNQRIAVVLIHAMDWTEGEVASLIGRSRSTVRTHLERGLRRLRADLEVDADD